MKARIKETGEIIEGRLCTDGFAHIVNDAVVGMYSPFEYKLIAEELPMAELSTTEPDWNQIKIQAAIAAMQGVIGNSNVKQVSNDELAILCVSMADALITELKKQTK